MFRLLPFVLFIASFLVNEGRALEPSPSPLPSSSPAPIALLPVKLSPVEMKRLMQEFKKAQRSEFAAAEHRNRFDTKELWASQKARQKEWEIRERDARHKYFSDHKKGNERREYIKDFIERRKNFLKMLAEERNLRHNEQTVHLKAIKDDQDSKTKEFKNILDRQERPDAKLWPRVGH